jgi:hypothetical protein
MTEILSLLLASLLFYIVPAIVIALFGRIITQKITHTHSELHKWEYGSIFLPFLLWYLAPSIIDKHRTLSNDVVEPLTLGIIYGILQVLRIFYPKRAKLFSLIIPAIATILIYLLIPALPE